jgi:hypothetical protein
MTFRLVVAVWAKAEKGQISRKRTPVPTSDGRSSGRKLRKLQDNLASKAAKQRLLAKEKGYTRFIHCTVSLSKEGGRGRGDAPDLHYNSQSS